MIIAAGGFMSGQGLGVSGKLTSTLSSFNSSAITTTYGNLIASLNSANVALPTMPAYFTGLDTSGNSITSTISTTASTIAPDTKKFISNFNNASAFGSASFAWSAALTDASSKSFDDFGLGMDKFSSMSAGGLNNVFAGPGGAVDFGALSTTIKGFGTAFDTSNLQKMFTPNGFIASLQKQGLGNVGGLSDQLDDLGVDINNIDSADPKLLTQALSTVTGSELQKIIKQTGMNLPPNANVTSAADLLDARKVIPVDVLTKLPGGSLLGLGNALSNMGGSFSTPGDLSNMLGGLKVPSLPNLDGLSKPIPDDIKAMFAPMLGSGSGPFGNPTINDIIGTAAGHGHTDAFTSIVSAHQNILASPAGQNLKAAADALAADPTNTTKFNNFVAAQTAVVNSSNADLQKLIATCDDSITKSQTQLDTETSNLSTAGISPATATVPQPTQLLSLASKLHELGQDKQKLGFNEMLSSMASNDVYGDAIQAALTEGQNIAKSATAGVPNTTKIDPMAVLAKVQSSE